MCRNLFTVLLIAIASVAFAQSQNTSESSYSDGWNTVYVQYNPIALTQEEYSTKWFTGFTAGYSRSLLVSPALPMYIEAGLAVQYARYSDPIVANLGYKNEESLSLLSFKVPVSFMYCWDVRENLSIIPQIGIDFRINAYGKWSVDLDSQLKDAIIQEYGLDFYNTNYSDKNIFDKDDVEEPWNRFLIGSHFGANIQLYKKYIIGYTFGLDFNHIADGCNMKTNAITLGYRF